MKKHEDYVEFENGDKMSRIEFISLYSKVDWKQGSFEKLVKKVDVYIWKDRHYYHNSDLYILKSELSNFKVLDKKYDALTGLLNGALHTDHTIYADGDINEILKDHKAHVVKGSDWPYFFDVNGRYIKSGTSNWFKYLNNVGYISPEILEEYNGPDKESEHKK